MSAKFKFRISVRLLYFHTALVLFGIILAAVFVRFSPDTLLSEFSGKLEGYFSFSGFSSFIMIAMQESFWVLLVMALTHFSHSKLFNFAIILYKGFSIGIVSSLFCWKFGIQGILYIILMLLPQSFFYILSLAIAVQISFETNSNLPVLSGRHGKQIPTDTRAYIICFLLTGLAAAIECYVVPLIYQSFFK